MSKKFEIVREDGRSNQQVIIDLVADKPPGTVFEYFQIINTLSAGTNTVYTKTSVQKAVIAANKRLLPEKSRTLMNVRNLGYKIAYANEHRMIALSHKRKSDSQLRTGVSILKNVNWDEMDENHRLAHQGTLMVLSALEANQMALKARQDKVERAIKSLTNQNPTV